jgi:transcription termination factor NusB
MFIFSFDLRKPKFQVLVNNLAGVILCRLSKRVLDNIQTLQKKIRKKLNDLSVQVINLPMLYWDTTGNVDIYVIRNTKLDELVNKIKKRFNCCMSGQCAYGHSDEFDNIYYGRDRHEGDYILSRRDFHDFKDDLDLFSYLVGYNGLWLQFTSDKLKLNRKLILKATNNTLSAVMYIPIKLPSYNLTNQFNKIWDDIKIINQYIKFSDYDTFDQVSLRIRSMPEYAKQFVELVPEHIKHVSPEISNYRELCIIAVKKSSISIYFRKYA